MNSGRSYLITAVKFASFFQNHDKHDENANEKTVVESGKTSEDLLTPAFPSNGRRVSQVDQQCCGGFKQSGVCNVM